MIREPRSRDVARRKKNIHTRKREVPGGGGGGGRGCLSSAALELYKSGVFKVVRFIFFLNFVPLIIDVL